MMTTGVGEKPRVASLDPQQVEKVRDVEQKLGDVYVIAYDQAPQPADLSDEQLDALRDVEKQMPGVVLVAYRKQNEKKE